MKPLAHLRLIWVRVFEPFFDWKKEVGVRGAFRLFLSLLVFGQSGLYAESVTVTSYYPSPLGVYKNLRVTENTWLAVNSGLVGIGTAAAPASSSSDMKLYVNGTDIFGLWVDNNSTTGSYRYGIYEDVSGGTVDNYALSANVSGAGTNNYGTNLTISGAATNSYGVYSNVSGATNNYSFYGADGNVYVADAVGIGTLSPTTYSKLDIRNTGSAGMTTGYGVYASISGFASYNWAFYANAGDGYFNGRVAIGTVGSSSSAKLVVNQAAAYNILDLKDNDTTVVVVEDGGQVGMGTSSPSWQLYVVDQNLTDDNGAIYGSTSEDGGSAIKGSASGTNGKGVYGYINGNGGAGGEFLAASTSGNIYGVKGTATSAAGYTNTTYGLYGNASGGANAWGLYVAAGKGYISCAAAWDASPAAYMTCTDLAEIYHSGEPLEPGDVVIFKRENSRQLFKSAKSYDENLAGVYSSYPGMILGTRGEGDNQSGIVLGGSSKMEKDEFPLALAGRVPVKVTDEGGKIEPGDRVTSSSKAGYAMKATKSGRVLGVALETFDGKEGKVLIMVNPQWWDGGEVAKLSDSVSRLNDENESLKLRLDKLEKKLAAK